jgi:hypothetical protein
MRKAKVLASLMVLTANAGATGCSHSSPAAQPAQGPQASIERVGRGSVPSVVLTHAGAARIGVRTALAVAAGPDMVIPYAALLYEPDGDTAVYVNTGPLVYTRDIVSVDYIAGDEVYVRNGLTQGARVVTTGAEELLGVQNGVGEQT